MNDTQSKKINLLTTKEIDKAYHVEIFQNREQNKARQQYALEKKYYSFVSRGDSEGLEKFLDSPEWIAFIEQMGKLSPNTFKQELYGAIIGVALTTRAALEGGLPEDEAFTLSDIYIQKYDECQSIDEIRKLQMRVPFDFARRVASEHAKYDQSVSVATKSAMEFILKNLHYNLTLSDISDHVGLSENYFCSLFKKETGESVTRFINQSKIKEAENLLKYASYSLLEISQFLGFCTQSHFSQVFKKFTGMTPGQYRKSYQKI